MNPLTNMKNVIKLSERELGVKGSSWHDMYKNSAWIFIGGLPYDLTEGDVICIFSQYGEVVNINLIRDKASGKPKGFCFLCYENQRSTVLAVDNLNGIKILNRAIRVDHVVDYKPPKEGKNTTAETLKLYNEGCAVTGPVPVPKKPDEVKKKKEKEEKLIKVEKEEVKIKKEDEGLSGTKRRKESKTKKRKEKETRVKKKLTKRKDEDKRAKAKSKKRRRRTRRSSSSSDSSSSSSESSSSSSSDSSSDSDSD